MGSYTYTHFAAATAAVVNQFVTAANMKNDVYTLANAGAMPSAGARHVTVTHAIVAAGTDTLGTITVVGKSLGGQTISEAITPLAGTIATSTKWFASVTSVTGAGWAIAGGNDTIQVGCSAAVAAVDSSGVLMVVAVNTTANGTVTLSDSRGTIGVLKASIGEGTYAYGVSFTDYLGVALTAASDITVVHSGPFPTPLT